MLIYLGTGSQFNPEGKHWINNDEVADFVLQALQMNNSEETRCNTISRKIDHKKRNEC